MSLGFDRYVKIFLGVFASVFVFVGAIAAFVIGMRLFFSAFDALPWAPFIFWTLMLTVIPGLFLTANFYLLKRVKAQQKAGVRIFSSIVLYSLIALTIFVFARDIFIFYKEQYIEIDKYYGFSLWYIITDFGLLFFITLLWAVSADKEKDWMEKHRGGN